MLILAARGSAASYDGSSRYCVNFNESSQPYWKEGKHPVVLKMKKPSYRMEPLYVIAEGLRCSLRQR